MRSSFAGTATSFLSDSQHLFQGTGPAAIPRSIPGSPTTVRTNASSARPQSADTTALIAPARNAPIAAEDLTHASDGDAVVTAPAARRTNNCRWADFFRKTPLRPVPGRPPSALTTQIQLSQKPTKKTKRRHLARIPLVDDAHLMDAPLEANGLALSRCFFVTFASFCKIQLVHLSPLRFPVPILTNTRLMVEYGDAIPPTSPLSTCSPSRPH